MLFPKYYCSGDLPRMEDFAQHDDSDQDGVPPMRYLGFPLQIANDQPFFCEHVFFFRLTNRLDQATANPPGPTYLPSTGIGCSWWWLASCFLSPRKGVDSEACSLCGGKAAWKWRGNRSVRKRIFSCCWCRKLVGSAGNICHRLAGNTPLLP